MPQRTVPEIPLPSSAPIRRAHTGLPAALIALVLTLAASACSSSEPSPSEVAHDYIQAIFDLDRDTMVDLSCTRMHAYLEDNDTWRDLRNATTENDRVAESIKATHEKITGTNATVKLTVVKLDKDKHKETSSSETQLTQDQDGHWKVCADKPRLK